jgi:hypothetical protein
MVELANDLALSLDRVAFARKAFRFLPYGDRPDAWQEDFLRCESKRIILNCARQSGKTTVVATLALHTAMYKPRSFVLIFAPTQDQSTEFFRRVAELAHGLGMDVVDPEALRKTGMDLKNGSRIEARPGTEKSARSRTADLIVIDEAARVDESLYHSIRPMLAVTRGALVVLSTPHGKRGFFHDVWISGPSGGWERYKVTAEEVPRITEEFLEDERVALPRRIFEREYLCVFNEADAAVFSYEDVAQAITPEVTPLFREAS